MQLKSSRGSPLAMKLNPCILDVPNENTDVD